MEKVKDVAEDMLCGAKQLPSAPEMEEGTLKGNEEVEVVLEAPTLLC